MMVEVRPHKSILWTELEGFEPGHECVWSIGAIYQSGDIFKKSVALQVYTTR